MSKHEAVRQVVTVYLLIRADFLAGRCSKEEFEGSRKAMKRAKKAMPK